MTKPTWAEKLLVEGADLIHKILILRSVPEELRIKLLKWRMAVEAFTKDVDAQ